MYRLILSNRWLALLYVALMAGAAVRFAGPDGAGVKAVGEANSKVAAQRKLARQQQAVLEENTPQTMATERAAGEGYDPTPQEPAGSLDQP